MHFYVLFSKITVLPKGNSVQIYFLTDPNWNFLNCKSHMTYMVLFWNDYIYTWDIYIQSWIIITCYIVFCFEMILKSHYYLSCPRPTLNDKLYTLYICNSIDWFFPSTRIRPVNKSLTLDHMIVMFFLIYILYVWVILLNPWKRY
jgi:hypothetical protein